MRLDPDYYMGQCQALSIRTRVRVHVVKAAAPGKVPAVSQRHPELFLLWADIVTEQLQGRGRQQRRDHRGRQVIWILCHHLWKNQRKSVITACGGEDVSQK